VNFDIVSDFLDVTRAEIAASAASRSQIRILFHGTKQKAVMRNIIDENLRMPNQKGDVMNGAVGGTSERSGENLFRVAPSLLDVFSSSCVYICIRSNSELWPRNLRGA
jgi:hypothetical protein